MLIEKTFNVLANVFHLAPTKRVDEYELSIIKEEYETHLAYAKSFFPASAIEVTKEGSVVFEIREPVYNDYKADKKKIPYFDDFSSFNYTLRNFFWLKQEFLNYEHNGKALHTALKGLAFAFQQFERHYHSEGNGIAQIVKKVHNRCAETLVLLSSNDISMMNRMVGYQHIIARNIRNFHESFNQFASGTKDSNKELHYSIDFECASTDPKYTRLSGTCDSELKAFSNLLRLKESNTVLDLLNSEMETMLVDLYQKFGLTPELKIIVHDYYRTVNILFSINSIIANIILMNNCGFFIQKVPKFPFNEIEKNILCSFYEAVKKCTAHLMLSSIDLDLLRILIKGRGNIFKSPKKLVERPCGCNPPTLVIKEDLILEDSDLSKEFSGTEKPKNSDISKK